MEKWNLNQRLKEEGFERDAFERKAEQWGYEDVTKIRRKVGEDILKTLGVEAFDQRLKKKKINVIDYAKEEKKRRRSIDQKAQKAEQKGRYYDKQADIDALRFRGTDEEQIIATLRAKHEGEKKLGIDFKTGALNKLGYDRKMEELQKKVRRYRENPAMQKRKLKTFESLDQPFALITLDVNNFKKINKEYGYEEADVLLKKLKVVIQEALRDEDILARIGGDEFRCIVLGVNGEGAKVAERIRSRVAAEKFMATNLKGEKKVVPLTISVGVASHSEKTEEMEKHSTKAQIKAKKDKRGKGSHIYFYDSNQETSLPYEEDREVAAM